MYLLYVDESGNPHNPEDRHFVLSGAAVFERQTFFLSQRIDRIQEQHFPRREPIEFHAQHIRSGKGVWGSVDPAIRTALLTEHLPAAINDVAVGPAGPGIVLFAVVVRKSNALYGDEAVAHAIGELLSRFDILLMSRYHDANDAQRGLLVFDESGYQAMAKMWIKHFQAKGTRLGSLKNIADIPFFARSADTRLLQLADFVAHAVFQLYEHQRSDMVAPILNRFHIRDGRLHGLVHLGRDEECACPTCYSRRRPGEFGPWVEPGSWS